MDAVRWHDCVMQQLDTSRSSSVRTRAARVLLDLDFLSEWHFIVDAHSLVPVGCGPFLSQGGRQDRPHLLVQIRLQRHPVTSRNYDTDPIEMTSAFTHGASHSLAHLATPHV